MFSHFDPMLFIIVMAVLIIAITIHEFAHAITSDRLGDPTPRRQGRISLLPPDHLDPFGTIMMVLSSLTGFGIGWGKPVQTNSSYYKHPRRDDAIVAAAGPFSNLIQAIIFALILRLAGGMPLVFAPGDIPPVYYFLYMGVQINLALLFFNLIPILPLDGWWIMTYILPQQQAMSYRNWMIMYGPLLFLGLVFLAPGVLTGLIRPPVEALGRLLVPGF